MGRKGGRKIVEILKSKVQQSLTGKDAEDLIGKSTIKNVKYIEEMAQIYANSEAAKAAGRTLAYTVYAYTEGDETLKGNLNWGLSVLEPVTVDGEYNMTRGHFHVDRDCAEFYFGISGNGLLLLMDESGKTWAEKVEAGSVHHIDGHVAHRLINSGDVQLKVGACWPTTAGHDYDALEEHPFQYRVFREEGEMVCRPNVI